MKSKLRFGEFLIERGVATPADVLQALDHQNGQRKPFHRAAVDLGFLSVKDAYAVYNHRAGTEETFEEAAVKLGHLTPEQVDRIKRTIETENKRLGEILVAMNVVTSRVMVSELREFKTLQRQQEALRDQFGQFPLFEGSDEEFLDALVEVAVQKVCDEEQTLFSQGEPPDGLWAVTNGVVRLTAVHEEEGDEADVWKTYVHPGEVFGESVLLGPGSTRPATAVAEAGSALIALEAEPLREVLAEHPAQAAQILERLLARFVGRLAYADISPGALGLS